MYGGPLSPAGPGKENGFWKFDRFQQQVRKISGNKETILESKYEEVWKGNKDMTSPEIYLWVDDHEEEKRENAVDDHVGVSQVNLDLGRSMQSRI